MNKYLFSIISCKYLVGLAILLIVFTFVLFLGTLCFDILFTYLCLNKLIFIHLPFTHNYYFFVMY